MRTPSLRKFLDSWPYDPEHNVRVATGANGRQIMLVRQPLGLDQYEVEGRPDGQRPHGMDSVLEFQLARLATEERAGNPFKLTAKDCAQLFEEGTLYYHRFINLLRLKDWIRAERDTARNLHLVSFVARYAEHEEDRVQLEQWRLDIVLMNAIARAMVLQGQGQSNEAIEIAQQTLVKLEGADAHTNTGREALDSLLHKLPGALAILPGLRSREDSVFSRHGDYWTIAYQGQVVRLKATRGLHCLAFLLRHPAREFHVGEVLVSGVIEVPTITSGGEEDHFWQSAQRRNVGPILDEQAKAEYKRRLEELRRELDEAQRFNDESRATKAQQEMNSIAEQIAAAVGLGGRGRSTASTAERARSTVTHRIKESIKKIDEVMPALARHLSARIKTGHFCSYNPHPERPVAWKG